MTNPCPGYKITTPYKATGSLWPTCGWHTGVDYKCPAGTRLVAAIAGQIRHRSYGSSLGNHQFAISPDANEPFGADEVFYAHTRTRLPDGTRVKVGEFVAEAGQEGNATGPHLHFEFHTGKNSWSCGVMKDPAPVISHQSITTGSGPFITKDVYSNKVGYGEPTNGDAESDTVKELRSVLDHISLAGGQTLGPSPGVYDMEVDEEVRLWQAQVVNDPPDPPGKSYLGPNQFAKMFPSPPYTRHDAGLPAIATGGDGGNSGGGGGDSGGGDPNLPPAPSLMLPGAVWNPIPNYPGLRPFTGTAKKITLHTTETEVKPNWEQQGSGIPHLTVDLHQKKRWQHLDFNIAAYTLNGGTNSPNSGSGQNIQIEIIGYTRFCPSWPQNVYDELAEILHWLCDNVGIPYSFPANFEQPIRMVWEAWEPTNGIIGHCHAPYNNHTDPTGLRVDFLSPPILPEPGPEYLTRAEFEHFRVSLATAFRELAEEIDPL